MDKIINISLAKKGNPVFMDVVQGATAPSIQFVIDDWTPEASSVARIYILKDGGEVYNSCTLSGNVITYNPTAGSFDVPGQCVAQLEIVKGNKVAVSWRIFVTVEPNLISGSAAPASTEFGALTDLIIDAQNYDTIINANNIVGANNRQGWTALTTGQDLNTILSVGEYAANSDTIAGGIVNSPFKYAFKLVVAYTGNNNARLRQRLMPISNTHADKEWVRSTTDTGTTWSEWQLQPTRAEVNYLIDNGAKNMVGSISAPIVNNGITYTPNEDGSITANGTATAASYCYCGTPMDLTGKTVTVNGCPEGGSGTTYRVNIVSGTTSYGNDEGNGYTVAGRTNSRARIFIANGYTADNLTFYPMIRDASIQDDTYVPYGMSNAELTQSLGYVKQIARDNIAGGAAGNTYEYVLESIHSYIVTVGQINIATPNTSNMYLLTTHTNGSSITTLAENSNIATIELDKLDLSILPLVNYVLISIIQIA